MRHYEDLQGGRGRTIFYRPDRYRARDLFRRGTPALAIGRNRHILDDISLNGLGASAARGTNNVCHVGDHLPVELDFQGVTLFEGRGEIARVDATPFGTKIGIRLVDACLNIPQLVAKSEEILVRRGLEELGALDHVVGADYRRLCADIVHLLRGHRVAFERLAETNPSAAMTTDMLAASEERALPRWRELWHAANAMVEPIMGDATALAAYKHFTELVLTPEFMGGAIWRRSYEKPLGYPGDFRIMNMVYDWRREGATLFEQFLHRLGLEVAECIATRMVMMREEIAKRVIQGNGAATVRIANLGCGPAREVVDFLQLRSLPRPVQFTLIDQDRDALSEAYQRSYPEIMRLRGQAGITCLFTTFARLLKTGELFGKVPPQDLIYSVGLIDYLAPHRARALVSSLYGQLAPGGTLLIGNMMKTVTGNLWPMEFICDWSIVYRDEQEMMALAQDIENAAISTALDPTGRVCLLRVQKS